MMCRIFIPGILHVRSKRSVDKLQQRAVVYTLHPPVKKRLGEATEFYSQLQRPSDDPFWKALTRLSKSSNPHGR